ncbi:hypothetical protein SteCoe_8152 [Stentor coeruleus]|uniref:GAR domain-containing protein n=1 Tax=Stentor coeruleus TaxID=5963 RepID=A0A1R2CKU5_9CILI|nr:hypothetical protein SteCoe_8152 [Stentor coeruleus]
MLKDSFEGKIIRVDGFSNEEITCKLFSNDKLLDEFIAKSSHKPIQLSGKGIFRFVFESVSLTRSISLKLSLFQDDGAQWLPLLESNDFIETLPEETSAPRFLIVLCKSKALHIIEESGEISEDSSLSVSESEEIMPEIKLCDDFRDEPLPSQEIHEISQMSEPIDNQCNTQEFLESLESEFLDQSSIREEEHHEISEMDTSERLHKIWEPEISALNESQDRQSFELFKDPPNYKTMLDDLNLKYQQVCKLQEIQAARVAEYDMKFVKMFENHRDLVKRSKEREDSLIELVNEKEKEAHLAQEEILRLRSENSKFELENKTLKENNESLLKEIETVNPAPLLKEVAFLRKNIAELEKILANSYSKEFYEAKLVEKDQIITSMHRQLRNRPCESDTRESQNSSISIIDELDESVRFHAKSLNLLEPLIRDKEQMYIYGHRKLSLMLFNGNLMCRIGGTFKPFKEYMENYVLDTSVVRPLKKRFTLEQNIDKEYDFEHFKEAQAKTKQAAKPSRNVHVKRKSRS